MGEREEYLHHVFHGHAHLFPDFLSQEAIAHPQSGFKRKHLTLADFCCRKLLIVLLKAQHAECHMASFVGHHIAQHLAHQRLFGEAVHEAEGC